mmetsp:Transcript_44281/g.117167  ORF Transcript_44281/g.117167 Transcript_44281/m.117167 type:complete len:112 (+) Transcript_44281:968-1303(+)
MNSWKNRVGPLRRQWKDFSRRVQEEEEEEAEDAAAAVVGAARGGEAETAAVEPVASVTETGVLMMQARPARQAVQVETVETVEVETAVMAVGEAPSGSTQRRSGISGQHKR